MGNIVLKKSVKMHILVVFIVISCVTFDNAKGMHIIGTWNSVRFSSLLAKFSFNTVEKDTDVDGGGYVYGNVTLRWDGPAHKDQILPSYSLMLLDNDAFPSYDDVLSKQSFDSCSEIFDVLVDKTNYKAINKCNPTNMGKYTREVPCPVDQICPTDNESDLVQDSQFTFKVLDKKPRYWFLTLLACYPYDNQSASRNCTWAQSSPDTVVDYNIWLINGYPNGSFNFNPFKFQFSYEQQTLLQMFMVFAFLYTILFPAQITAQCGQSHPLVKLLTLCLFLEYIGVVCYFIHYVLYAVNGAGMTWLEHLGQLFQVAMQCCFMLLLLLLAKGWTITRTDIHQKKLVLGVWAMYSIFYVFLYFWQMLMISLVSDVTEYQTFAGAIVLALRLVILIWFLYELHTTRLQESAEPKLKFYKYFGIGYFVWFIHLPILVIIAALISPQYRLKALTGMILSGDLLSISAMVYLLWPSRNPTYFKLVVDERKVLLQKYGYAYNTI
ncbi:transmembrane protein 145-like [Anneissia japonica]|uniref:transmembrane protein 145-like n=1 Tax=Anneissia japonica TaxID=1529436 RepID=UPI00142568AC|nr:transmembrane protein 145-like [Anneissia japonica]